MLPIFGAAFGIAKKIAEKIKAKKGLKTGLSSAQKIATQQNYIGTNIPIAALSAPVVSVPMKQYVSNQLPMNEKLKRYGLLGAGVLAVLVVLKMLFK